MMNSIFFFLFFSVQNENISTKGFFFLQGKEEYITCNTNLFSFPTTNPTVLSSFSQLFFMPSWLAKMCFRVATFDPLSFSI